jgi:hypothetical protein
MKTCEYNGTVVQYGNNRILRCTYISPEVIAWQQEAKVLLEALTYLARRCQCGVIRPVHIPPYGSPVTFILPHLIAGLSGPCSTIHIQIDNPYYFPGDDTDELDKRITWFTAGTKHIISMLTGTKKFPPINVKPLKQISLYEQVESVLQHIYAFPAYGVSVLPGSPLHQILSELMFITCDYSWAMHFYNGDNHTQWDYWHFPLNYGTNMRKACVIPPYTSINQNECLYAYSRYGKHVLITTHPKWVGDTIAALDKSYNSLYYALGWHQDSFCPLRKVQVYHTGDTVHLLGAKWRIGRARLQYRVSGTDALDVYVPYDLKLDSLQCIDDMTPLGKYLAAVRLAADIE